MLVGIRALLGAACSSPLAASPWVGGKDGQADRGTAQSHAQFLQEQHTAMFVEARVIFWEWAESLPGSGNVQWVSACQALSRDTELQHRSKGGEACMRSRRTCTHIRPSTCSLQEGLAESIACPPRGHPLSGGPPLPAVLKVSSCCSCVEMW